jgi:hypothetical protein
MRINVYAEELPKSGRGIELRQKTVEGRTLMGLRVWLYLPVTVYPCNWPTQISGPFMHNKDDDDSSAVTFWGSPQQLRTLIADAQHALDMIVADGEPPTPKEPT